MTELTDKEVLKTQIRQLKEAVAAMENRNSGSPGIEPEEIWQFMRQKMDDDTPLHPRIIGIFNGHVEIGEVRTTMKRLENDLNDLEKVEGSEELYDPMEHEIEDSDNTQFQPEQSTEQEEEEPEKPQDMRDKEQRPLSAYQNTNK